jgi:glycopeptide antibiotics resistance protein
MRASKWKKRIRNAILCILIICYSMCLLYWMFIGFGRVRQTEGPLSYNLVPFETIKLYIRSINHLPHSYWIINLFGNIGVFVPFGLILPILSTRLRSYWRLTLYFVPIVVVIELSQMLLRVGSCDIDDVILNVIGVWIGYGLLRGLFKRYIS